MKNILSLLLQTLLIICCVTPKAHAAGLERAFTSLRLTSTYVQPVLYAGTVENSDSYEDVFSLIGNGSPATYEVNYLTDDNDPIIFVSLTGGRIVNFERGFGGTTVKVTFTVPNESSGNQSEIRVYLFTKLLFEVEDVASGFADSLSGAWFDSLTGGVLIDPFISHQEFTGLYYTFNRSVMNQSDSLRAFFPDSATTFLNNNKKLAVSKIRAVKTTNSNVKTPYFDAAQTLDDGVVSGVLITTPNTFAADDIFVQINISALGGTGLYGPARIERKNPFEISAFVKDCTDGSKIKLERKLSSDSDFKKFKTLKLSTCQAAVTTTLTKSASYRFVSGKKTYTLKVKIK